MTSTHEEEGQSSSGSEVRVKQIDGRTDTTESITILANVVGNEMPSISSQQFFHGEFQTYAEKLELQIGGSTLEYWPTFF